MENVKSIKSVAKEAKKRLKSRFWEDYKTEVASGKEMAVREGISESKVESYFKNKMLKSLNRNSFRYFIRGI